MEKSVYNKVIEDYAARGQGWEKAEGKYYKGTKSFWDDAYIHDLDHGDGFIGVCICKNSPKYTL